MDKHENLSPRRPGPGVELCAPAAVRGQDHRQAGSPEAGGIRAAAVHYQELGVIAHSLTDGL